MLSSMSIHSPGSFSPAEVGRGSGPFGQDVICGHHRSDASPQEAIYPVLLGNWATAVPRTDKSPSWFSATSANSTYFLPSSLAYLPVTVPRINSVSPSGLWRLISQKSLWSRPSSPIQLVTAWLSHEQRSGP